MLRPEVNGYEVTWKYVCKPYWCEVLKGYRLVLSGGKPLGTGWDELHANHKVLYVNHEMKVMNLVKRLVASGKATRLANRFGVLLCPMAAYVCDAEHYAAFCCEPLRVATLFAPGR